MYVVIMAGGGGTRLRPLSTAACPKPFLPLLPTGETLLQRTVRRLTGPELALDPGSISIVASGIYEPLVRRQVPGTGILVEPAARNTAAAIALAALALDRSDDDVMAVLPADHRIDPGREGVFRDVLRRAADGLAAGAPFGIEAPLVTLGVQPTRPATEYGYLRPRAGRGAVVDGLDADPLEAFEEKPGPARARELLAQPGVAWNAGMFLWRRRTIRAALEAHAPDIVEAIAGGLAADDLGGAYERIRPRSIDYAVMEPAAAAGRVVMAAMDVGWTDIGSWTALLDVLGAPGIEGGVVEPGTPFDPANDDLVLERVDGELVVSEPPGGTIVRDQAVAHLRGARDARPILETLVDRCARGVTQP